MGKLIEKQKEVLRKMIAEREAEGLDTTFLDGSLSSLEILERSIELESVVAPF